MLCSFFATGSNTSCGPSTGSSAAGSASNAFSTSNAAVQLGRTIPLYGCTNADYFVDMPIGRQLMRMLLDSGSTDTAVASTSCSNCSPARPLDTVGATMLPYRTSSLYVDGSGWDGAIWTEQVSIGDKAGLGIPATALNVAVIDEQSKGFDFFIKSQCTQGVDLPFDGLVGLGDDNQLTPDDGETRTSHTQGLMTQLALAGASGNDLFAVQICDMNGFLWIGDYSAATLTEEVHWVRMLPITDATNGYAVALSGITVGQHEVENLSPAALSPVFLDTGTGLWQLPNQRDYDVLVAAISADANFQANFTQSLFDASAAPQAAAHATTVDQVDAALPTLSLTMTDTSGQPYTMALLASQSYLQPVTLQGKLTWRSNLGYSDTQSGGYNIFGNSHMRNRIIIFDRAHKQAGFAAASGCSRVLPTFDQYMY